MLTILLDEFVIFLKDKKIIEGSIMFAIGNMLRTLIMEINDKIVIPFSEGNFNKIKKQKISTFVFLLLQIIISSYIFFLLWRGISFSYDKILASSYGFL